MNEGLCVKELDMSKALCHTEHRKSAHLWDEDLDSSTRSTRAETPEQRRQRHDKAKAICRRCTQLDPCYAIGVGDPDARGVYGAELL
ncbi:WhiB family transcription factor [Rhodococcus phage Polyyuki]|nr:WhiB family transcription factor [Rhodococcus phage Polyyuki]